MFVSGSFVRSPYELYGICPNCGETRFHYHWCRQCEFYSYQSAHPDWTSENSNINLVIQSIQANAGSIFSFIEWIEYDQFEEVEYIGKGGFSSIFGAMWNEGPRDGPPTFEEDKENRMPKWKRRGRTAVILKSLAKSQNIKSKFFSELRVLSRYIPEEETYTIPGLLRTYGITRNPQTQEFMLVIQHAERNSLYEYLATQSHASIHNTTSILRSIARGLFAIHQSELVHGNLHGGNILVDAANHAYISDTGVSKSADPSRSRDDLLLKGTFGVVPYVAPEVLLNRMHTKSSDIYSFGIIMWQLWSGQRPFVERAHDSTLCTDIYNGLRPHMIEDMPEKYREIVSWCLDATPSNRPSVVQLLTEISELEKLDRYNGSNMGSGNLSEGRGAWNEGVRRTLYRERQTVRPNLKAKYFSRFIPFLDVVNNVKDKNQLNDQNIESGDPKNYIVNKVREVSKYQCVTGSITPKDEDFRKLIDWFYWAT